MVEPPVDGYVEERSDRYVESPSGRVVESAPYTAVSTAPPAAAVDEVHATAYDPYANRRRSSYKLVQGIWLLFGIVVGILAIRFILKLLGANEAAGFASFIYGASAPFVAPFSNLFANPGSSGSILELTTMVAIIVYMLVAWLIAKVIWLLAGENRSATRTVASSTRARLD
jgi:YggT family protein